MNISVTCPSCQKNYQVDVKLGGRTVKCKACGNAIVIPRPEDELLEPAETPYAPPPPPPPQPAAAPVLPEPEPLPPEPDLSLAPPPLPDPSTIDESTGMPVPPAPKVVYRPIGGDVEERDYRGYRINREHRNSTLATLENLVTVIGQVVFWIDCALFFLLILLIMIALHAINVELRDAGRAPLPALAFVGGIFLPIASMTLYAMVGVPFSCFAADLAGKVLMFDIPEEPRWRITAADAVASIFMTLGLVIDFVGAAMDSIDVARLGALCMLFGVVVFIPLHFLLIWLVLRLKPLEALLAWPFIAMANVILWGSYSAVVIVCSNLLRG